MRKITKKSNPPIVRYRLKNHMYYGRLKCDVLTEEVCRDFDCNPMQFEEGKYVFSQEYGYDEFRKSLKSTIGSKCCYCEKPIAEGEIEHFRPKSGYKQDKGQSLLRPGYYWLAYSWNNMLLCCDECNDQKRKGNLFPLKDESKRAKTRSMKIKNEKPILIDPSKENPAKFISFNLDKPIGIDKEGRGGKVIEIFDLENRGDLIEERRKVLKFYQLASKISNLSPDINFTQSDIEESKIDCKNYLNPKTPFSGMLVENLRRKLI